MPRGDYALVTHPDRQPAVDFLTRSVEGPFVDTGVDVILRSRPGEPLRTERVYLSVATIRHLFELAEGISGSSEQAVQTRAQLVAQGKIEALKEGLHDDISRLARDLHRIVSDAGLDGGGAVSDPPVL